ncbi:MAG: GNAT family N-acetyltransferase [Chloroflexi bacterium]|nr:GNAT family N-acetyltransferase [Chloroflexota bacterium]
MPDRSFVIRPATPEDDGALAALEYESAIHHATIDPDRWRAMSVSAIAESRRFWQEREPRDVALVADADGRVVGMVELWLRRPKDPNNARVPRVEAHLGISVASAARGQGVGTALMLAAEEWARAHGADRMDLGVDAANEGAKRLYERLGYEVHGHRMDKVIEPAPGTAVVQGGAAKQGESVPTLHGARVTLRPLRADDRTALVAVLSDPTVAEWWDSRGAEVSAAELLADDPTVTVFAIEVDGELAGSIQYSEELEPDYRHAGIDIFMSSGFQGRGIGTDAVRTMARYLLEVRGHHRLTIDPAAANARAIHVYAKVGFRPVGVMRRYERGQDGTFHDGLLMDMLAGELR